ncbi:GEM protein 5 [Spatholobus suberectus]|nr:GEM protein 5 [Spatholobus suberectus]
MVNQNTRKVSASRRANMEAPPHMLELGGLMYHPNLAAHGRTKQALGGPTEVARRAQIDQTQIRKQSSPYAILETKAGILAFMAGRQSQQSQEPHFSSFLLLPLSLGVTNKMNTNNNNNNTPKNQSFPEAQGAASSSSSPPENWGTHIMGTPAVPSSHPDNKKAALQSGGSGQPQPVQYYQHPYVQHSPVEKPSNSPMESILNMFNSWSKKAEATAHNVWHNLKTGPSVSSAALGKMNLTVKAISEGGFESLYKQTFTTYPNEKLKKSFASYLSTSTGPVAGTLYLSNIHVAFCSDRPLCFTAPSGQETWTYYKVFIIVKTP